MTMMTTELTRQTIILWTLGLSLALFLRSVVFCGIGYWFLYGRPTKKQKFNPERPMAAIVRTEMSLTLRNSAQFGVWAGLCLYVFIQGHTLIYTQLSISDIFYLPFSFLVMAILQDAYFYWAHRFMHTQAGRWIGHSVHHRFYNPTPWSAYAMSAAEFHVQHLFYLLIIFVLPLHPVALGSYLIFSFISNVIGHCGFELWKANSTLLGNSLAHYEHHRFSNVNYSLYLTIWDKMMKTRRGVS